MAYQQDWKSKPNAQCVYIIHNFYTYRSFLIQCNGDCCGQQTQKLEFVCGALQNGEMVIFPRELCEGLEKPHSLLSCRTSECVEQSVGEWSVCPCGGQGFRNRTVSCMRGESAVEQEVCSRCYEPVSTVQVCNGVPCPSEWGRVYLH